MSDTLKSILVSLIDNLNWSTTFCLTVSKVDWIAVDPRVFMYGHVNIPDAHRCHGTAIAREVPRPTPMFLLAVTQPESKSPTNKREGWGCDDQSED